MVAPGAPVAPGAGGFPGDPAGRAPGPAGGMVVPGPAGGMVAPGAGEVAGAALAAVDISSRPASRDMVTRFIDEAPWGFGREPFAHRGRAIHRVRDEARHAS